jgi:hypothetical protein
MAVWDHQYGVYDEFKTAYPDSATVALAETDYHISRWLFGSNFNANTSCGLASEVFGNETFFGESLNGTAGANVEGATAEVLKAGNLFVTPEENA